ncbi:MAG: serine hydrolase [Pseudomonadales bacterium]|nr:serine hydrolase [Pseudomonadales bacterium]
MHDAIQKYVDLNILSGASSVVIKDNEIVDLKMWGQMDMEKGKPMQPNTIFRIFFQYQKNNLRSCDDLSRTGFI